MDSGVIGKNAPQNVEEVQESENVITQQQTLVGKIAKDLIMEDAMNTTAVSIYTLESIYLAYILFIIL